jgi:diacylglycerol kinase family enzyme
MVREADLFSDRFFIYCFHSENPLRYFQYAWAILAGRQSRLADFTMFPAQQIRCEGIASPKKQVSFQVDGEFVGPLPCTIEIVPDALTLLVPSKS